MVPKVYRRLLVPIDGSALSALAAKKAVELAKLLDSEIRFLHVIDSRTVQALELTGVDMITVDERVTNIANAYLNEVVRHAEDSKIKAHREIRRGLPAEEILESIKEHGIDLVVMGSKGLTGARRAMMGSTTEDVLRLSPTPVLVVK